MRGRVIVYTLVALISLAGLADATYLTVLNLTGATAVCGGAPDCYKVLGSSYARIAGVPLAAFGMLAYFAAFSFATFAAFGYPRAHKFFALTVGVMFVVTLGLLGLQAFVLHAFCRYCLFSAAMTFLLAGLVIAAPPSSQTA
jgi:uncharacterized membrane protein